MNRTCIQEWKLVGGKGCVWELRECYEDCFERFLAVGKLPSWNHNYLVITLQSLVSSLFSLYYSLSVQVERSCESNNSNTNPIRLFLLLFGPPPQHVCCRVSRRRCYLSLRHLTKSHCCIYRDKLSGIFLWNSLDGRRCNNELLPWKKYLFWKILWHTFISLSRVIYSQRCTWWKINKKKIETRNTMFQKFFASWHLL